MDIMINLFLKKGFLIYLMQISIQLSAAGKFMQAVIL